jgi:hypothetical protein
MSTQRITAAVLTAATLFAAPAFAQKFLSGEEAQRKLAGQRFAFACVDGTRGQASYSASGLATASYLLAGAGAGAAIQKDQGRVRAEGSNICIRWNRLMGGEEACFRMAERAPGQFRIADGPGRWCDLTSGPGDRAEMD